MLTIVTALVSLLTSGLAAAAPTAASSPSALPDYYLAFQTGGTAEAPIYKNAKLVTNGTDPTSILIIADCESPSSTHRGVEMNFNKATSSDRRCLMLTGDGFRDVGATIGTPLLGSSSPAYSYPIYAITNSEGDCRWSIGSPSNGTVSVFPGIYEANEGIYACKALVNGKEETVLSLGKTGPNLDSPQDCINTNALGFAF